MIPGKQSYFFTTALYISTICSLTFWESGQILPNVFNDPILSWILALMPSSLPESPTISRAAVWTIMHTASAHVKNGVRWWIALGRVARPERVSAARISLCEWRSRLWVQVSSDPDPSIGFMRVQEVGGLALNEAKRMLDRGW